jgi:hypothetical protein
MKSLRHVAGATALDILVQGSEYMFGGLGLLMNQKDKCHAGVLTRASGSSAAHRCWRTLGEPKGVS